MAEQLPIRPKIRWHIPVFLAPAVLVYTAIMIFPLFSTLQLSLYNVVDKAQVFVGLDNFRALFGDPLWSDKFWNALGNNLWFFFIPHAGSKPHRRVARRSIEPPKAAHERFLSNYNFHTHHPVLRNRRLRVGNSSSARSGASRRTCWMPSD